MFKADPRSGHSTTGSGAVEVEGGSSRSLNVLTILVRPFAGLTANRFHGMAATALFCIGRLPKARARYLARDFNAFRFQQWATAFAGRHPFNQSRC